MKTAIKRKVLELAAVTAILPIFILTVPFIMIGLLCAIVFFGIRGGFFLFPQLWELASKKRGEDEDEKV